jgi:hypothetical protein
LPEEEASVILYPEEKRTEKSLGTIPYLREGLQGMVIAGKKGAEKTKKGR